MSKVRVSIAQAGYECNVGRSLQALPGTASFALPVFLFDLYSRSLVPFVLVHAFRMRKREMDLRSA